MVSIAKGEKLDRLMLQITSHLYYYHDLTAQLKGEKVVAGHLDILPTTHRHIDTRATRRLDVRYL